MRRPDDRSSTQAFRCSSVEAGVTFGWHRYADDTIGIERFGVSAAGNIVMDKLGINVGHVVERAKALLDRKE